MSLAGLLFTPGQLARRSEFYRQLAQFTSAGINLTSALDQMAKHPPSQSYREPIQRTLESIHEGHPLTDSLQRAGSWLPEFDLSLIRAGEYSGRLDECLRLLADYYEERARVARQIVSGLLYPAFLFHFAVFIIPFPQLFLTWDFRAYLLRTLPGLFLIYSLIALAIYAGQSKHGETWRAILESLLNPVPVFGSARRCLALGRLAAALEALLGAGVTIIEAWQMAAIACGSIALRRVVSRWRPELEAGRTPAELVSASHSFPELFASQYATGEISGKLDEALRMLRKYYLAEGSHRIALVAQWLPRLVYLVIVVFIAIFVLTFYIGRIQQIMNAVGS